MKPDGHKKVAEDAGIWRLKMALEQYGISRHIYPSGLDAFYLGNWLADHSQFKDPHGFIAKSIDSKKIQEVLVDIGQNITSLLESTLQSLILELAEKLPVNIDGEREKWIAGFMYESSSIINRMFVVYRIEVVEPFVRFFSANTIDKFIRSLIRYKAYSKFVYPERGRSQEKIDYVVFSKIFDNHYTQYYPHEHLDRPISDSTLSDHTIKKQYSGIQYADNVVTDKYLYKYIEDAIKVIVGQLHDLDMNWAKPLLSDRPPIDRSSMDWHIGLSNLGRVLHLIEDFFAHSNFVETIIMNRSSSEIRQIFYDTILLKKALSGKQISWQDQKSIDNSIESVSKVRKRLKKYSLSADFLYDKRAPLEEDESIVTGYFDGQDTIIAIIEAIIDGLTKDKDDSEEFLYELLQEIFENILEYEIKVIQSITGALSENQLQRETAAFRTYLKKLRAEKISKIQKHNTILKEDLVIIITAIFSLLIVLAKILLIFIYLEMLIKKRQEEFQKYITPGIPIQKAAFEWFKDHIVETIGKYIVKRLLKSSIGALDEYYNPVKVILDHLGKNRIGSHSLLAKDLPQEPLYAEMFNCAKTVHLLVVDAMCRWSDEKWKDNKNTPEWIDWEHLLFSFLRHPKTMTPKTRIVKQEIVETYIYLTKGNETFETIFNENVDKVVFSFEYFLYVNSIPIPYLYDLPGGTEVNLPILKTILERTGRAFAIGNNKYQLKPNLHIKIPYLSEIKVELPDKAVWYDSVIMLSSKEWTQFMNNYINDRQNYYDNTKTLNNLYNYEFISEADTTNRIKLYADLKAKLNNAYNAKW